MNTPDPNYPENTEGEPGTPPHWIYHLIPARRADARWYNWFFWAFFGNDEDGIFWPRTGSYGQFVAWTGTPGWNDFWRWWFRNSMHNLMWHVLKWPWAQHEADALVLYDSLNGWWYRREHRNWANGGSSINIELLPLYFSWCIGERVEGYIGWKLEMGMALRSTDGNWVETQNYRRSK